MVRKLGSLSLTVLAILTAALSVNAQVDSGLHARPRITQSINETNRVALEGNTRPEASPANDRGAVANDFAMEHMLLQLKRSPQQEQALQQFIDELNTKGSPNFHHWLTAQEFGERYGLAKSDLDAVAGWLASQGFRINVVYPSGMLIDFSGTAAHVRKAFQTEIHRLVVNGERHVGNISDPRIPASLAPVVAGVVSLHDFRPHAMHHLRKASSEFTFIDVYGNTTYALVPADLAKIYNLSPLFSAGISGQGQTIVLIEDTDVFSSSDWSNFRQTFGLSSYNSASFTQLHPPAPPSMPGNNCAAPGVIAPNDAEAILDAEWASASAPSAAIEMAACADTSTTFGGLIAIQNLINASTPPPSIMSISYGQCETVNGAAANAAYNSAYQQAVAEGVSVFVAAGDSGAAGCDNSVAEATHGIAVNAFASTPNNVAVGGTDFSDTYSGTNATYWNSSNTPTFGSALSYIPEIPWNDSCAGALLSAYENHSPTYGSTSLCNDPNLGSLLMTTVAGGGGPSQCASGTPSTAGVVSGSCAGWPKPSWQAVLGNPSDGVRDTPDVSLFAADGLWSHYYVFCWSDTANGGAACGTDPSVWSGAGGTSFASPIMAGIQALINQKAGGPQGNPAPVYYQLAAAEYGSSGSSSCNSNNGNAVSGACIFYDVTWGDMDVDCVGPNCFLGNGSVGVLSASNSSFAPAYGTTIGWDFATGIGTLNAANLVNNWPASVPQPGFTLSASPTSLTFLQGAAGSTTITINPLNGFTSSVSLTASGLPSGISAVFGTNPATATSLLTLSATGTAAIGTFSVTVTGTSGSLSGKSTLTLTVNPVGDFTLSASPSSLSIVQGAKGTSTITVTPQNGFNSSVSLSPSGLPSGVTAAFNPGSTTTSSTLTLTASSTATMGTVSVTIRGTSGNLTHSGTISLTVTAAPPNFALSASPSSLSIVQGAKGTSTITVTPQSGFSSSVTLSASGLPSGVTASFNPSSTKASSTLTFTASSTASTGTFSVSIRGASGSLSHTTTISVTVTAPVPNFTLSASPSSLSITQGASGASTITVTPLNGFNSSVSLSASGLPSGVTASFNPNPATTATSTLTLTASSTATTGAATVTITGTSGSLASSTTINLTVTAAAVPSFALSASPSSLSIVQGTTGTSTITITPQNSFSGSVSLSASGLPSGVTASFNPGSTTATSTLTLTASSTALTGTATVTINGISGSLTHSTTIALTVKLASNFPPGWLDLDIGSVGLAGSASYANGTFTVNGAGTSAWGTADGISFTYQPLSGDGSIVARVVTVSSSSTGGVLLRDSLNANAMSVFVAFYGSSIYSSYRTTTGGSTSQASSGSVTLPYWVKVLRSGSTLSSFSSLDGVNWAQVGTNQTINMGQNVYIGLGVSSGSTASLATATFDSVSINSTAAPAPVITSVAPNTGAIGTQAMISGSGFGTSQAGSTVTLNGAPVTINSWSNTALSITIPSGAVSGPLLVSVAPSMNASNPVTFAVTAQPLPAGWLDQDVGQVGVAGSATYTNGTFTVNGAGTSAWGTADGINFMYQPLSGDGSIVARVLSVSPSSTGGVMIRETLNANSTEMFTSYYAQNIYMSYRTSTGGSTSQVVGGGATLPYWVKVVRSGSTLSGYSSLDGVNWVQLGTSQTFAMAQSVYIGLAVSSGSTSTLATATFDNVSVQ
jgi:hypothetical protein